MRVGRAKHQSGFTIIELLIVIVVIGILAALVLTAYGNIHGKAQASVTKNIVQQYTKALLAYKVDNGHYPTNDDLDQNEVAALPENVIGGACLGTGYSQYCASSNAPATELQSFHELMKPYIGTVPNISPHDIPIVVDPGSNFSLTITGVAYVIEEPNPSGSADSGSLDGDIYVGYSFIIYALDEPDAKCVGGKTMALADMNGNFETQSDPKNTLKDDKNTACVVLLADSIVQP
ncbi:prepilin-type N-terminal cleavage/methylation domain-containing protein [Candidatus Saccharibacteria bacterium]|nr:prepilin-type N-terminal cleavage/methylation domain-containing protein [Candidatus Saccharibacteria bacterium]